MSTSTFLISGGGVTVQVTVEEIVGTDGYTDLQFTYTVISNKIADIRGVFFHVNESVIDVDDLSIVSGDDVTDYQFDLNTVVDLGNGANMEGVKEGPFDAGVEIGTAGASPDDIQSTTFVLSLDGGNLTLQALAGEDFGVRLNSVGAPNSPRDGSLKLVDDMPLMPIGADPITLIVEEEDSGLGPDGNEDVTPNPEDADEAGDFDNTAHMADGTLTFTAGTLPLNSFVFEGVAGLVTDTDGVAGQDLYWVLASPTQIIGYSDAAMTMAAVQIDLMAPASIDSLNTGDVTVKVTLMDNLLHDPTTGNIEDVLNLGTVKVLASDGVSTVDGLVTVKEIDDIPVANLADLGGAIVVDETVGENPGEANVGLGQITVAAAALFTDNSSFGADGPASSGATVYSLVLNNSSTGLVDTLTGEDVVLSESGGVISGKTAISGDLVFTLSVDGGTGDVTLTQERAVVHNNPNDPDEAGVSAAFVGAGSIGVQVAVTDADNDTVTNEIDIGDQIAFEDDGPTAGLTDGGGAIVVDESIGENANEGPEITNLGSVTVIAALLFTDTSVFGSDGPLDADHNGVPDAGATIYSLLINSASTDLVDTLSGQDVVLSFNGGVIEGRTETGGDLVFTLSINLSTGAVTLTQERAVVHNDPNDPDEAGASAAFVGAGSIGLQVTVTDGDGDSDTAQIDIGDKVGFEDDGPAIGPIPNGEVDYVAGDTVDGALGFDAGSDGPASPDPLKITDWTDFANFTETLSADGKTLTYSDATGDVFKLEIDGAGGSDANEYLFTVLQEPPLETFKVGSAFESGPPVETIKVAAEDAGFITFNGTINGVDLGAGDPDDDLNPDQLGFGVFQGQSSNINPLEGFIATFTGPDMTTPLEGAGLEFKVDQTGNTDHVIINWVAYAADGTTVVDSGSGRIELQKGNNAEFVVIGIDEVATDADSGSFVVSGEFAELQLVFEYDDNDGRDSVRVEDFGLIDQSVPPDEVLQFTVEGTDGDGDSADDTFQIGVDGDGGGVVFPAAPLTSSGTESLIDEFEVFVVDDGGAVA